MNAKLIANGKTIDYEISDTEYNRLFKRTGLEKPVVCGDYYAVGYDTSDITVHIWKGRKCEENFFDCGLISTDEKVAQDRFRAIKIKTKLERFAAEHNKGTLNFNCDGEFKYYLSYNYYCKNIIICNDDSFKIEGVTYFSSDRIAEQAIEELDKNGELTWYLRDYQPWIGAYKETY